MPSQYFPFQLFLRLGRTYPICYRDLLLFFYRFTQTKTGFKSYKYVESAFDNTLAERFLNSTASKVTSN